MFYKTLDDMAVELHTTAVEKGFWPEQVDDIFVTKQLMMIVSEAVEVMEAIRKSKGDDEVADEMADIIIRTLDLWQGLKENGYVGDNQLQIAINKKTDVNKSRPQKHGVKF